MNPKYVNNENGLLSHLENINFTEKFFPCWPSMGDGEAPRRMAMDCRIVWTDVIEALLSINYQKISF